MSINLPKKRNKGTTGNVQLKTGVANQPSNLRDLTYDIVYRVGQLEKSLRAKCEKVLQKYEGKLIADINFEQLKQELKDVGLDVD